MALDIYREVSTGVYSKHSLTGATLDISPVSTIHDGVLGEIRELKLFVRADNVSEYYTNITAYPESLTSPDDTDGVSTGWGVKLRSGSVQPTEAEWEATDYANTITLSNIGSATGGDINTYLPFWYRVECPAGAPANVKENIVLSLSYSANAV